MALQVIELSSASGKPHVTLTSTLPQHNLAIMELQSADARRVAIQHAAQNGIVNARCEMPTAPYAVDSQGVPVTQPATQKIAAYRVDVPVNSGM